MIEQQQRPILDQAIRHDSSHHDVRRPIGEEPSQLNQVDDTPAVETPVEARGGFLGKPVALVLGISLALAVLAGIVLGFIPV